MELDELARRVRIRIRSWKDIVVYIVGIAVYILLLYGLPKLFPNLSQKAVNIIAAVILVLLVFLLLIAVGA